MRSKANLQTNPSPFKCQTLQDLQEQILQVNKMQRIPTETDKGKGSTSNLLLKFENYLDSNLRVNRDQQYQSEHSKYNSRRNSEIKFMENQTKNQIELANNYNSMSRKPSYLSIASTLKQDDQTQQKLDLSKQDKLQKEKSGLLQLLQNPAQTSTSNNYIEFIEQRQRELQKKALASAHMSREQSPSLVNNTPNLIQNSPIGYLSQNAYLSHTPIQKKVDIFQYNTSNLLKTSQVNEYSDKNQYSIIGKHKRNQSAQLLNNGQQGYIQNTPLTENKTFLASVQNKIQNTPLQQKPIVSQPQQIQMQAQKPQYEVQLEQQIYSTQKQKKFQLQLDQKKPLKESFSETQTTSNSTQKRSMLGQYNNYAKKQSADLRHININSYMSQINQQDQQNENQQPYNEQLNQNVNLYSCLKTNNSQQKLKTSAINSSNVMKSYSNKENDDSYIANFNLIKKSNNDLSIFYTSNREKDNTNNPSNGKSGRSYLQANQSNLDNITCNFQGSKQDTKVSSEELDDSIRNILYQKINFQNDGQIFEPKQLKADNYIEDYNDIQALQPDDPRDYSKNRIEYNQQNSIEEQVVFNNSLEQNQQEAEQINQGYKDIDQNNQNQEQINDEDFSKVKINEEISSKQIKTLSNIFKICDTKNLPIEYVEQLIQLKNVISEIISQNQ
ncbi:hypothetical protein TTHERM_00439100 (macronuclear) [Tetrahymena thermophila SB210]|uniref:Uncharacterized protein n=1 Tax=Tetrahymena thermophila (strain SB210) TaxID=312017 RepID=I7M1T8_TETTS|nr:hypothetical protein TTHERM_00439100 [Tetrahymena thermophila SB210]EAR97562.2 hypothetical protein TTHERM_00439100 [Tetrahymena thermophila SB210]|eukprot:XP_001017807.2 hypothetical protein TTHERM_00439100 [Tetrahymena thermophila SB210]